MVAVTVTCWPAVALLGEATALRVNPGSGMTVPAGGMVAVGAFAVCEGDDAEVVVAVAALLGWVRATTAPCVNRPAAMPVTAQSTAAAASRSMRERAGGAPRV
jgi:hypothetical protein